jgi:hypothetical protein
MFLQRLRISALVATGWMLATSVQAQGTGGTGGSTTSTSLGAIRVTLISIGDRTAHIGQNWAGIADCTNDEDVVFRVDGAPRGKTEMDLYIGDQCQNTDRVNPTVNRCTYLGNKKYGSVTLGVFLHINAKKLFEDKCDAGVESKPKIYFLAVNVTHSAEDVNNDYGVLTTLGLDTLAPSAPSNLSGGEGEHKIPVSWDSSETNLKGFKVYIDPHPGAPGSAGVTGASGSNAPGNDEDGGSVSNNTMVPSLDGGLGDGGTPTGLTNPECPSSFLISGNSPMDLPSSIHEKTINKPTATTLDLTPDDIDSTGSLMKDAAIAVVAVDLAENESPLSSVACVHVEPTTAFWDRYQMEGGKATGGCPCSAMGAAQIEDAWPVGFAVMMLGLSAQRRRRS